MTGFQDAVNWFYHWESSAIVGTSLEQQLLEIFNPSLSETDRANLLAGLLNDNAMSPVLPELLLQIGIRYRRLDVPQNGLPYITQAVTKYSQPEDVHHLNCLRWLYGCMLIDTGCNLAACLQWRKAIAEWSKYLPVLTLYVDDHDKEVENHRLAALRCIELEAWHRKRLVGSTSGAEKHRFFTAKYQLKAEHHQMQIGSLLEIRQAIATKQIWYQQRISDMRVALMVKPVEAYQLVKDLQTSEPNRLSQGFISQRSMIEDLIADQQLEQAIIAVERLVTAAPARSDVEKAETFLVSGWARHESQHESWEADLKKAIFRYPQATLARVWARWLLGAIQWSVVGKHGEAADNWSKAIEELKHLQARAEWQNQPKLVNDMIERLASMQGALALQRNNLANEA